MGTLTVRLPDDKHDHLKSLAAHRKVSINRLMEELSTQTLAEFDSEVRFRAFASVGRAEKAWIYWINWTGPSKTKGI